MKNLKLSLISALTACLVACNGGTSSTTQDAGSQAANVTISAPSLIWALPSDSSVGTNAATSTYSFVLQEAVNHPDWLRSAVLNPQGSNPQAIILNTCSTAARCGVISVPPIASGQPPQDQQVALTFSDGSSSSVSIPVALATPGVLNISAPTKLVVSPTGGKANLSLAILNNTAVAQQIDVGQIALSQVSGLSYAAPISSVAPDALGLITLAPGQATSLSIPIKIVAPFTAGTDHIAASLRVVGPNGASDDYLTTHTQLVVTAGPVLDVGSKALFIPSGSQTATLVFKNIGTAALDKVVVVDQDGRPLPTVGSTVSLKQPVYPGASASVSILTAELNPKATVLSISPFAADGKPVPDASANLAVVWADSNPALTTNTLALQAKAYGNVPLEQSVNYYNPTSVDKLVTFSFEASDATGCNGWQIELPSAQNLEANKLGSCAAPALLMPAYSVSTVFIRSLAAAGSNFAQLNVLACSADNTACAKLPALGINNTLQDGVAMPLVTASLVSNRPPVTSLDVTTSGSVLVANGEAGSVDLFTPGPYNSPWQSISLALPTSGSVNLVAGLPNGSTLYGTQAGELGVVNSSGTYQQLLAPINSAATWQQATTFSSGDYSQPFPIDEITSTDGTEALVPFAGGSAAGGANGGLYVLDIASGSGDWVASGIPLGRGGKSPTGQRFYFVESKKPKILSYDALSKQTRELAVNGLASGETLLTVAVSADGHLVAASNLGRVFSSNSVEGVAGFNADLMWNPAVQVTSGSPIRRLVPLGNSLYALAGQPGAHRTGGGVYKLAGTSMAMIEQLQGLPEASWQDAKLGLNAASLIVGAADGLIWSLAP